VEVDKAVASLTCITLFRAYQNGKQPIQMIFSTPSKFLLNLTWINIFAAGSFMNSAVAQVVLIPHGDYENDFEKYLVVIISFVLLWFAAWRFYRSCR